VPNTGTILLAEDNEDDVLLIRMAFKRSTIENPMRVVGDGREVIRYLQGLGPYSDRKKYPVPQLLLLDLKMPNVDGFEVLTWIRKQPEWKSLPAVVLTTSFYGPDIKRAYTLGANSFLTKPADFDEFVAAVRQLAEFWLQRTTLPATVVPLSGTEKQENGLPAS